MVCWSSWGISRAMNVRRRFMRSGGGRLTAKSALYGLLQIEEADRLCQVRGCASLHAVPDIGGQALGGNNHHGDVHERRIAAHLAQNIQTRNFRHHNIEQNNIWLLGNHRSEERRVGKDRSSSGQNE